MVFLEVLPSNKNPTHEGNILLRLKVTASQNWKKEMETVLPNNSQSSFRGFAQNKNHIHLSGKDVFLFKVGKRHF